MIKQQLQKSLGQLFIEKEASVNTKSYITVSINK